MNQYHSLCQQAVLTRQWLATQDVIRRLTHAGQGTPEQLGVLFEVLDALERALQHQAARHDQASPHERLGWSSPTGSRGLPHAPLTTLLPHRCTNALPFLSLLQHVS